jgi:hypothetical protein
MTMTPEDAREILGRFLEEKVSTTQAEAEGAYVQWLMQREIVWGGITQSHEVTDEDKHQRNERLTELHFALMSAANGGPPAPEGAAEEHDAIIQQIYDEAQLELATNGLPHGWKPQ